MNKLINKGEPTTFRKLGTKAKKKERAKTLP